MQNFVKHTSHKNAPIAAEKCVISDVNVNIMLFPLSTKTYNVNEEFYLLQSRANF